MLCAVLGGLVLGGLISGCDGGGGGGGGGGGSPTDPTPGVTFVPDAAPSGPTILLRDAGSDVSTLRLELFANEVENVHTVAFGLIFPTDLLRFSGAEQGAFLGAAQLTVADSITQLILDTRLSPSGASGTGVILSLTFEVLAPGSGRIDFLEQAAAEPNGLELLEIDWISGEARIVL